MKYIYSKTVITLSIQLMILFTFCFTSFAQEEENEACATPTDKSIVKLLDNAHNKKKYKFHDRYEFLKQATEEDENCAICWYELAMANYKLMDSQQFGTFNNARNFFKTAIDLCPGVHSNAYYYLGLIYYGDNDNVNCLKYFNGFLDFDSDDKTKFAHDYEKKYADVKEIVPEIEFYAEFFGNPVPFYPRKVEGVCSSKDEYLPMLSPDNSILLYTRSYSFKNLGDVVTTKKEELTMSKRTSTQTSFDKGNAVGEPFISANNYGGITISVTNKEMYITICKPIKLKETDGSTYNYNNCDIYVSHWKKMFDVFGAEYYQWSTPVNLGDNINNDHSWESQPSLSGDGQTLYFAKVSAETDSTDIYFAKRLTDSTWSKAQSIGSPINTPGNEKAPFIHSDSQTLYYAASSSPWRLGAGKYDIFYTKLVKGHWSKPKNIGYPINTKGDEHGLFVSADGKLAYFASNKLQNAQGYDVFSFELPESARPEKIAVISGRLLDNKGQPATDVELKLKYIDNTTDEIIENKEVLIEVDEEDGSYAAVVNLSFDKDVLVEVVGDSTATKNVAFTSKVLTIKDTIAPIVSHEDIEVREVEKNTPYTINDIRYNTNSADLQAESKTVLKGFAQYLLKNTNIKLAIYGNTDDVGDATANMALSSDRAFTVMSYLVKSGVDKNRLSFQGFGSTMPKVPNSSASNRAINRRTEFVITAM